MHSFALPPLLVYRKSLLGSCGSINHTIGAYVAVLCLIDVLFKNTHILPASRKISLVAFTHKNRQVVHVYELKNIH
jgi:hypothetical protein